MVMNFTCSPVSKEWHSRQALSVWVLFFFLSFFLSSTIYHSMANSKGKQCLLLGVWLCSHWRNQQAWTFFLSSHSLFRAYETGSGCQRRFTTALRVSWILQMIHRLVRCESGSQSRFRCWDHFEEVSLNSLASVSCWKRWLLVRVVNDTLLEAQVGAQPSSVLPQWFVFLCSTLQLDVDRLTYVLKLQYVCSPHCPLSTEFSGIRIILLKGLFLFFLKNYV